MRPQAEDQICAGFSYKGKINMSLRDWEFISKFFIFIRICFFNLRFILKFVDMKLAFIYSTRVFYVEF